MSPRRCQTHQTNNEAIAGLKSLDRIINVERLGRFRRNHRDNQGSRGVSDLAQEIRQPLNCSRSLTSGLGNRQLGGTVGGEAISAAVAAVCLRRLCPAPGALSDSILARLSNASSS